MDSDYKTREALPEYEHIKFLEDLVINIQYRYVKDPETNVVKQEFRDNLRTIVIAPGVLYGLGERTFKSHFKVGFHFNPQAAWLSEPLPYFGSGENKIPTIHVSDLAKFVKNIAENTPAECPPYLLAVDNSADTRQSTIIRAISQGIGRGEIKQDEAKDSSFWTEPKKLVNE